MNSTSTSTITMNSTSHNITLPNPPEYCPMVEAIFFSASGVFFLIFFILGIFVYRAHKTFEEQLKEIRKNDKQEKSKTNNKSSEMMRKIYSREEIKDYQKKICTKSN